MSGWISQGKAGSYAARRGEPMTLAEQVAVAALVRSGEPIARIAQVTRRPIPEVRSIVFGDR